MTLDDPRTQAQLRALPGRVSELESQLDEARTYLKLIAQYSKRLDRALDSVGSDELDVNVEEIAAGSNLIGRVDARDGDKIWSYHDVQSEDVSETNLDAGTNILNGAMVPAGEIWKLTQLSFEISSSSINIAQLWVAVGGVDVFLDDLRPPTSTKWYTHTVDITMQEGDRVRVRVYNATAGDTARLRYVADIMQI